MVYFFKEGRDLVGFEVTLFNIPGALEYIASVTKRKGLNIFYIENCFRDEKYYGLFIAVDFTDSQYSPVDLINDFIRNKMYVADVVISPSLDDIIFPSKLCVKNLGGMRAILMASGSMRGIILGIKKELGEESGETILYHLGYDMGEELYKIYAEPRGIKDIRKGIMLLEALARGGAWADIAGYEIMHDKIIIRHDKLWECEVQKGLVDKPASHLLRGVLAGFFKELLGKRVDVNETKCIALGDPYCQFEISVS